MKRSPLRRNSTLRRTPFRAKRKASRIKVLSDGREICYGEAWEQRKREVWERDAHRCQWEAIGVQDSHGGTVNPLYLARCQRHVSWDEARLSIDHVVKRSKRRDDRLSNLRVLCAYHHRLRHEQERKLAWSKARQA